MKTLLTLLGSALLVATSVQFATAAERHHGKADRTAISQKQPRNVSAYASWPQPTGPQLYGYTPGYYSGGYSAPAGR